MSSKEITTPEVFVYGSAWVRADFHMHTRADKEFYYTEDTDQFIGKYVEAMKNTDIRIAVITNHNKFDLHEFKAIRKEAKKRDIYVLAGVELSVKDGKKGIHTLVVFKDDWFDNTAQTNHIQNFLGLTFAGQDNFENENGQSNHDLNETIRELDKYNKDYFLICAHVEAENGLWGGFGGASIKKLGQSDAFRHRCLGFQKVRTHEERKKAKEWLGAWYPAEVEGCDCKSIDEIGRGEPSYLKIGSFTYEAVKFAMLDHANRVASVSPKREHSFIQEVTFEGAKLEGTKLCFSSELNTFIGIRGSGKSSVIESVRYALGIDLPENADRDGYKEGSVKHALGSGGKITIKAMDRHGQEYEIRRILGEQPDVYVNGMLRPGINIRETILHKPIYFGQKDLSSTGQGFESDLIEKLVGDNLAEIRHEIAVRKQAVVETVRRLQKLSDVSEKQTDYQNKQADAEHRLKVFNQYGVEEKLQKQVDFEQDTRTLNGLTDFVDEYIENLVDLVSQYDDDFRNRIQCQSKRNAEFLREVMSIFKRVADGFDQIKRLIEDAQTASIELKAKANGFESMKGDLKEEFAEVARKLSEELKSSGATAVEPDEFLKLRKAIDSAKQMLVALAKEKDQQTTLQQQLVAELTNLNEKWHEEFRLIKDRLELINQQKTALQIDIDYKGDKVAFLKYLKDIFRGSKLRETTLDSLTREFADGAIMYREMEKARKTVGVSSDTFAHYFHENLTALLTWQVPNKYTIKYHGKQLKNHSLGQRASALILFVLSQRDNDVVMIDQPEDDLDNQTIYEDVIKLVKKLKPESQFIFATHNPNIPVLGDAEQVIACTYGEDHIQTEVGSIDSPVLQDAIVNIMEGGEEAFKERKRIYQVWKQQNS